MIDELNFSLEQKCGISIVKWMRSCRAVLKERAVSQAVSCGPLCLIPVSVDLFGSRLQEPECETVCPRRGVGGG